MPGARAAGGPARTPTPSRRGCAGRARAAWARVAVASTAARHRRPPAPAARSPSRGPAPPRIVIHPPVVVASARGRTRSPGRARAPGLQLVLEDDGRRLAIDARPMGGAPDAVRAARRRGRDRARRRGTRPRGSRVVRRADGRAGPSVARPRGPILAPRRPSRPRCRPCRAAGRRRARRPRWRRRSGRGPRRRPRWLRRRGIVARGRAPGVALLGDGQPDPARAEVDPQESRHGAAVAGRRSWPPAARAAATRPGARRRGRAGRRSASGVGLGRRDALDGDREPGVDAS